ncbi:hypothetical protein DX873_10550 [Flagellimonas nanhaiensis]|uniref:Phospholipase/carboxylesterase/thioesterase domain-containing protein n=1 Tax=Flagellimonas nanhaiensis TaxID=2292706 RepID=A0A371JQK0_9FLAO|nr:hypothetical protein DX873_10550 [Allomuricauda nanhaiensis]
MACFSLVFLRAQHIPEKGVVHDSVQVPGTNGETYALYLPKSYSENTLSPILFIYSPNARGSEGVKTFLKASEKYGLVLACSNNSKNGPYDRNFAIANNLFNHIFSFLNIKQDEMWVSGFSGGSRLASAIASLTNQFAGVVGCGAGFSEHMPSTQNFLYVGLCGNRDMNYGEMISNKNYLDLIKFKNTLITYDADHRWPTPEHIVRAFDWLYLQKLKQKNPQPVNQIQTYYQSDTDLLNGFLESGDLILANEQYERILKDYETVIQVDSLKENYRLFQKSKAFKEQKSALDNALGIEEKFMTKLRSRFSEEFEKNTKVHLKWWEKELNNLEGFKAKDDVELQKMVDRVKFDLFVRAYGQRRMLLQTNGAEQLSSVNRLIKIIYPSSTLTE